MHRTLTPWALLAPTLLVLGIIGFLPFLYVLYVGFFDWNVFSKVSGLVWAGINNYRLMVNDADFLAALGRGVKFTVIVVSIEMVLGMFLAQTLLKDFPLKKFFRAIHSLPLTVAPIVVGAIWKLMVHPAVGPFPYYLNKLLGIQYNIGIPGPQAFWTTVMMDVWHWTPFVTLTLLAGLSSLPNEPFEAAVVDGASRWQSFRYVAIPLLEPVIFTTLFLRIMDALRIVDEVWMLTGGGPGTSTRYVGIQVWRVVFPQTNYGFGSAISLFLLYMTMVLCWLLLTTITQVRKGAGQ
jgi:multiple sugar transport system permease protein